MKYRFLNFLLIAPFFLWSQAEQNEVNTTAEWTNIGPVNTGLMRYTPGTGRINAIAVDPNNSQIWYAGAPSGGLWKSRDAGSSWEPIFDEFPQIGISGIAIDKEASTTLYITTGDDDGLNSYSIGVMKSTDGGVTWSETGLTSANLGRNNTLNEITIHPHNRDIIFVAGSNGFYKSIDAGVTWTRSLFGQISVKDVTDFRLNPGDPDIIYAVTNDGFYRSTDGGENFTASTSTVLPEDFGRAVIGVSPASPDSVYVLYADTSANDYAFLGLYRSGDNGETFTQTSQRANILESSQAWFDLAIAVDPEDFNKVYIGCLNIWKSTNGGNIFNKLNEWSVPNEAYTHADIHTLKFFNNTLFAGTGGGLYSSSDGGGEFMDHSKNGIIVGQFYRISIAREDSSKIVGGLQGNAGVLYKDNLWKIWTGGNGMDYEIDPNDPSKIYGFSNFGSTLWITSNDGERINFAEGPEQGDWITPLTISANSTVYAGYKAVYKLSENSWEKISDNLSGSNIDDLEASLYNPFVLYAAEGSRLYISEDGAKSFRGIAQFEEPISDISINSNDDYTVYVTLSKRVGTAEYQQTPDPKVYKLLTPPVSGESEIIDITGNLPENVSFLSIVHQSNDVKNSIYIGTSTGVYRTDDTLISEGLWENYSTNLPSTAVSDLEISTTDATIVASTFGRGVFTSPIDVEFIDDEDDDNDGILDVDDNCPLKANPDQSDNDGDGKGDLCDFDDDNDGVSDILDTFPLDPSESKDTDSDGIGDNADDDDDNDGWKDEDEIVEGTNPLDASSVPDDNDEDGIGDISDEDDDNDAIVDSTDNCPLTPNTDQADSDEDGIGDICDTDKDNDGVLNEDDAFPFDPSESIDTDSDGIGNNADTDDDGDEVPDTEDAFPLDASESVDTDNDGVGNNADTDDDGDEVPDSEDAFPLDPTEAYDADGDGIGDNADDDDDNDQVKDVNDECPNSELGVTVDAKGCEVFALPSNTFSVTVTSATCPDSSNGSITISSSNTDYSYRFAIDDQAPQALTDNTQTISNLSAGIYTVCVTVDGVADYQRCYTIEITEPAPLVASSRIDMSSRNMQLDLSGSEEYQVTINGKTFLTTEDRLSLNLEPGMNRVEVATALDCQGVYFEEIFVSEEVKVYPNPTPGPLQLFVAGSDTEVEMSITSLSGNVIKRELLSVPSNRIVETSLGRLPEGLYLITLSGTTVKTTHKVIKE